MSDTTELSIPNSSIDDDIDDTELARIISRKPNLERLRLFGCSKITMLPVLPVTLTELSIDQCDEITLLENLPDYLVVLDCDMLTKLESIISPPLLRTLVCRSCEKLSNIDISLSNDLELLDATNCENLHNIIGNIPHSLERIIITETKSLQPETAQKLLDYYNIKDAAFQDQHSWWPRELPPIAATIQAMDDLGIERTNLLSFDSVSERNSETASDSASDNGSKSVAESASDSDSDSGFKMNLESASGSSSDSDTENKGGKGRKTRKRKRSKRRKTKKQKGKRRNTRKQKGKRRTKIIKRKQNKSVK